MVPVVEQVRAAFADLPISVDTWRSEVAEAAAAAGADLINDTWAGHDPGAGRRRGPARARGGVLAHRRGGAAHRPAAPRVPGHGLDGVVADVLDTLRAAAARAVDAGVDPRSVLVDATLDFGKTTWHSVHLLRRTPELVALGFPTLVALSRKDLVGESLDLPVDQRLEGSLAATAVAAWLGATVFRTHDVRATRRVVEMTAVLRGEVPPARAVRGLA